MSEWKLVQTIIQPFLLNCQMDLLASCVTNQLADYISWRPDLGSHPHRRLYDKLGSSTGLCPPFNVISKTLRKVTIDQMDLILVAPVWQAQPWWLVLLRLLISRPVLPLNGPTLVVDPTNLNQVHPMYPHLHLAVFHISTNISKLQQTLPIYSSQLLVPPPPCISG